MFFYFRDNFPRGEHRARLINGFEQWNVHNQTLRWFQGGFDLGSYPRGDCGQIPPGRNGIWWVDLPEGSRARTLGQTLVCTVGTTITSVTIDIDSDTPWYTGTRYPASNQWDLWATATHEVGHASGFIYHWDPNAGICQWPAAGNNYHTMCAVQPAGVQVQRDTEIHTETAFNARY